MMYSNVLKRLKSERYVITVSYGNYFRGVGGTDKLLQSHYTIFIKNNLSCIHLFPLSRFNKVFGMMVDDKFAGYFHTNEIINVLAEGIKLNKRPAGFYIHHMMNIDLDQLKLIAGAIDVPVNVYIHDYYMVCCSYNLLKDGVYCGGGNISDSKCTGCASCSDAQVHRRRVTDFLESFRNRIRFIAPSKTAKDIFAEAYPQFEQKTVVVPHLIKRGIYENERQRRADRPIRLAYVGKQAHEKGWDVWKETALYVKEKGLPYELYHFGAVASHYDFIKEVPVSFNKGGHSAMTEALRENDIDMVFLWSVWPETYSYTYFESLAADAYIITCKESGNIGVETAKNSNGRVFDNKEAMKAFLSDTKLVNEALLQYRKNVHSSPESYVYNDAFLTDCDDTQTCIKSSRIGFNALLRIPLQILKLLYLIKIRIKGGE